MFDNRTTLSRTTLSRMCVAAAFAALVAGAVTYIPAVRAAPDARAFEMPTSYLKGDRLDLKPSPARSQQGLDCSAYNWPYYPKECLPERTRDVRIVSINSNAAVR